jgi:beta-RFAP synthase
MRSARLSGVSVVVPARLHLGFLDLEGGLGRRFGSLGITLEGPYTKLTAAPGSATTVEGPDAERARAYLDQLVTHYELAGGLNLVIEEAIPAHAGLGSGTQLALAVGTAVCQLYGIDADAPEIAQLLDRGTRSGIGLGAFLQGGVLLDGGKGETDQPPPIISRFAFPEEWRILLITDRSSDGVHGQEEVEAFQNLPPFPAESAERLCRIAVMKALPALAERDFESFGGAVAEIQRTVGDHFAPAQGGRFASSGVSEVLEWIDDQGIGGIGQSSWGPTGFALVGSAGRGNRLLEAARKRWPTGAGLKFELLAGRNIGATAAINQAATS